MEIACLSAALILSFLSTFNLPILISLLTILFYSDPSPYLPSINTSISGSAWSNISYRVILYKSVVISSPFQRFSVPTINLSRSLSLQLSNMDQISDEQKLEWLTATGPTGRRSIIGDIHPMFRPYQTNRPVPKYELTRFGRQAHRSSFGKLGNLPLELLYMVFWHLTCDDLEALHSCSTSGRMAVLGFPQYHNILQHAPTILSILKKTRLARYFTITQIYETFTSSVCTTCGQFGGYVFLPAFARCCLHCGEYEWKFLPTSRFEAKMKLGTKRERMLENLPQMNTIEGIYSHGCDRSRFYEKRLTLCSRELVKKLRDLKPTPIIIRSRQRPARPNSGYQRYMALTPLPCYIPMSASTEKGVYCVGCDVRAKEHAPSCGKRDFFDPPREFPRNCIKDGPDPCSLKTDRDRLHDSRHFLRHLQVCKAAQALLKVKWTQLQEKSSGAI